MRQALSALVAVAAVLSGCGTVTDGGETASPGAETGPEAESLGQLSMKSCRGKTAKGATDTPAPGPSGEGEGWRTIYRFPKDGKYTVRAGGLAAFGPGEVWAATVKGSRDTRLYRWDTESWRQVGVPGPRLEPGENFHDIAGTSSEDVWLLTSLTVRHWDGHRWTCLDLRSPDSDAVFWASEIAVRSRDDAWIMGGKLEAPKQEPYVLHWDGDVWHKIAIPRGQHDVSIVSADDVWATSFEHQWTDRRYHFMHWDGRRWERVRTPPITPPPGGEIDRAGGKIYLVEIYDTTASPSGDVWAAGVASWSKPGDESREEEFSREKPVLMHWDGRRWSYTLGSKAYQGYTSIASDGAGGVWAVKDGATYVHHTRDGDVRTLAAPDNPGGRGRLVLRELVNLPGSTSMLAIGYRGKGYGDTLVQAYGPLP